MQISGHSASAQLYKCEAQKAMLTKQCEARMQRKYRILDRCSLLYKPSENQKTSCAPVKPLSEMILIKKCTVRRYR